MPFIIIFNIIISVLMGIVLMVILGTSVLIKDASKKTSEKAEKQRNTISKIRSISYLVFFAILIIMIIVNLIF